MINCLGEKRKKEEKKKRQLFYISYQDNSKQLQQKQKTNRCALMFSVQIIIIYNKIYFKESKNTVILNTLLEQLYLLVECIF